MDPHLVRCMVYNPMICFVYIFFSSDLFHTGHIDGASNGENFPHDRYNPVVHKEWLPVSALQR